MREILFRGKGYDSGEWVYGNLRVSRLKYDPTDYVDIYPVNVGYPDFPMAERVYPETVGQFTGLLDKNGRKIFEGDILSNPEYPNVTTGAIYYGSCNCSCCDGVYGFYSKEYADLRQADTLVVIGNIHDNPELLGGDEDGLS